MQELLFMGLMVMFILIVFALGTGEVQVSQLFSSDFSLVLLMVGTVVILLGAGFLIRKLRGTA